MVFKEIVRDVIDREGGYVNHPKDPGGETKYGIAKRSHPEEDIRSLTRKRAEEIYYDEYQRDLRGNQNTFCNPTNAFWKN